MNRVFVAAAAIAMAAISSSALADDWWSGPEIGIQGGYIWGNSSGVGTGTGGILGAGTVSRPYSFSPSGGVGGAHAGYNWQFDHVVLGLEGDAEGGDVSGGVTSVGVFAGLPRISSIQDKMDFDASVRGKLGWAFDRVLLYGTGGVAFGDVQTNYQFPPGTTIAQTNGVRVGWTAGGGIDYAITPNWSAGLEYRYTDLGRKGVTATVSGVTATDSNEFNYNAVRLAITYRFAPPPPPPPMAAPMPAAAPAPAPAMARTFLVFFDFDKYNLTPDARRVIEAAAQSYKATGSARIDVSGYTDLAGTQAYNLRLSQRRADAVAAYLEKQGVPKNVLDVKWFGKEHPRVPTPDGVREPQNRRVEIVMP